MAITKIGVYRNPPEDITDFQGISELLMAYARDIGGQGMILTEWTNANEWPKIAMGSYIFHGGASYVVDTEDYTIGAPADGTYYLKIEADDETLAISWASSLSGYAWNPIYNGLYHPDQSQILPYQLIVNGAVREKWKITNLAQGGGFITANWEGRVVTAAAINASYINTGQGNFKIGQNLRATDAVTFATVNTGYGANEVYRIRHRHSSYTDLPSGTVVVLDSMDIMDIVFQTMSFKNTSGNNKIYTLKLPPTGKYVIVGRIVKHPDTNIGGYNSNGYYDGGKEFEYSIVVSAGSGFTTDLGFLIIRVS